MPPEFRQDRQDNRTWILEQLLRTEGYLGPRMYECADYCVSAGIKNDVKDVVKAWENWCNTHPKRNSQVNRL